MGPLARARRKLRHLLDAYLVERLLADRLMPAVAPLVHRPRGRRPPSPGSVGSVLVWNVDSLGDFLWTTPALRALRAGYPGAAITLVCNRACRDLAETNPAVDRLVPIDPRPFYDGRGLLRMVPELRGGRFDVMVVLEMGPRPADAARRIGRRLGVGYLVSTDLGLLKGLPDFTLPPNGPAAPEPWPAYFQRAVAHLGLGPDPEPGRFEVVATAADESAAAAALAPLAVGDGPLIGLHPGVAPYANLTKRWPSASFVALARRLAARGPSRFVLTGSADEAAECAALADRIGAATGMPTASTAGALPLRAVVALLRRLDALVVADTAALHLAAASGTPTVALFGATDDRRIAPPRPDCVALSRRLPCSPCHRPRDRGPGWPRCRFASNDCMTSLTPDLVESAVAGLLAAAGDGWARGGDRLYSA